MDQGQLPGLLSQLNPLPLDHCKEGCDTCLKGSASPDLVPRLPTQPCRHIYFHFNGPRPIRPQCMYRLQFPSWEGKPQLFTHIPVQCRGQHPAAAIPVRFRTPGMPSRALGVRWSSTLRGPWHCRASEVLQVHCSVQGTQTMAVTTEGEMGHLADSRTRGYKD